MPTSHAHETRADVLDRRRRFLRLDASDERALRDVATSVQTRVQGTIDELYDHLQGFSHLSHLLHSTARIEKLKAAQIAYYERLVQGEWDEDYLEGRLHIGRVHEKVGLDPEFYLGTYAYLFAELIPALAEDTNDKHRS